MNIISNETAQGLVFNIQRFCTGDGPGIRTTVFLKGCPLRCQWCHNPESWRSGTEISYAADKCIGCGACTAVCPAGCQTQNGVGTHSFDRTGCTRCGNCAAVCPGKALEQVGKTMGVSQVMEEVLRDSVFYGEDGGLTVSGGEPLAQPEFTFSLLKAAKESGLHTCVETSGYGDFQHLARLLSVTDIFLFDYKETDPVLHKQFTGVDNKKIHNNLLELDALGANIILRCPILPGCNDRPEHLAGIASMAQRLNHILRIDIEPGHTIGEGKLADMGYADSGCHFSTPDKEQVRNWVQTVAANTVVPVHTAGIFGKP